jgi:hypothetical protein
LAREDSTITASEILGTDGDLPPVLEAGVFSCAQQYGTPLGFLSARLSYPAAMSEGLLFLKPLHLNRDGTATDWDVREGKPSGRTIGRIYLDISTGGLWFWCLNDRAPSPAADRGYAPTSAKAMLAHQAPMARARTA